MSYYDHHQPHVVGVPPAQGYPPKDDANYHPPPSYHVQVFPQHQGYAPQYHHPPPPPRRQTGLLEGCLAAVCCCCLLDACF
ncbi:cysteine-rich and transmembrane domain-containing protein A [Senna tora]|uniref:Cysteine-rich and transmembrane domain-containing protein A n=1 Tax=Senna tora TaxID=362788 RepID=A0A834STY3_9FABA|nr:cysteine-rich and transmembrane domain-containing protein A [Senna tora]